MRNKEAKLVIFLSSLLIVVMTAFAIFINNSCCTIATYDNAKQLFNSAHSKLANQNKSFDDLVKQSDSLVKFKNTWRNYFQQADTVSSLWSEISRLAVSKNLLSRLQEEADQSATIEVDGNLDELVDLVREIENTLPHTKLLKISFKPSVYGEANMTMHIVLPEVKA